MKRSVLRTLQTLAALALAAGPQLARAQGMGMSDPSMGMSGGQHQAARGPDDMLPDVDEAVAADPQKAMERADAAFEKHDWLEAIAHYQVVRNRYSYNVQLAARAELRLADIAFEREKWGEARSGYRSFVRMHPGHAQVDYAAYRAGLATYKDLPDGGWITPPAEEKDQSEAKEALKQMREFVRAYPDSKFQDEARRTMVDCEDRLAAHELYVARYYAKRGKWRGTVLRAETVLHTYAESERVPDALLLCVQGYAALKEGDSAKKALEGLRARKPAAGLLAEAEKAAAAL